MCEWLEETGGGGITFGGGVAECCVLAEATDAETGDGCGDDYSRGVVESSLFLEEGSEPAEVLVSRLLPLRCPHEHED